MAKSFKILKAAMAPERRARLDAEVNETVQEMALADLRKARKLTQDQLAKKLHMRQAALSKLERRTNMYVNTLQRMIEKMGGELEIRARFPHADVRITQFLTIRKRNAGATAR